MLRTLLLASAFTLALPGCISTDKWVRGEAYASCKGKKGEDFSRCMSAEEDRVLTNLTRDNERCLEGIAQQQDRAAMIRGERAGDPNSSPNLDCERSTPGQK